MERTVDMTIGEKIRYYRKRMGITQVKLAELTGIHVVSIRKYETNKTIPKNYDVINNLSIALNINPNELFSNERKEDNMVLPVIEKKERFMAELISIEKESLEELKTIRSELQRINETIDNLL